MLMILKLTKIGNRQLKIGFGKERDTPALHMKMLRGWFLKKSFMGKSSKFKKIRKIASQMPALKKEMVVGERLFGYELLQSGIDKLPDGTKINHKAEYRRSRVTQVPLNHGREMKRLYNKFGYSGVDSYIKGVSDYVKQSEEKAITDATISNNTKL